MDITGASGAPNRGSNPRRPVPSPKPYSQFVRSPSVAQQLERPSDEEMDRILETYGRIRRRVVDWDFRHLDESGDYPPCQGEVVLLLRDEEGRLVAVQRRDSPDHWILPMGRIDPGERVEDTAVREAREETGYDIRVEEVAALHRARIRFKAWDLERWYFVVLGRCQGGGPPPLDTDEIADVTHFELPSGIPPEWAQSEWYLWILKDASLLHPHSFLIGKPPGVGGDD